MAEQKHIDLLVSDSELRQVALAANLRHVSIATYVKQAINARLLREGVDAVLLDEYPASVRQGQAVGRG